MQQKISFSYNLDAALHVISQINFSLDSDKYKFVLTSDERQNCMKKVKFSCRHCCVTVVN